MERDGKSHLYSVSPSRWMVTPVALDGQPSVPFIGESAREIIDRGEVVCVDMRTTTGNPDLGYGQEGSLLWRCLVRETGRPFFVDGSHWEVNANAIYSRLIQEVEANMDNRKGLTILLT